MVRPPPSAWTALHSAVQKGRLGLCLTPPALCAVQILSRLSGTEADAKLRADLVRLAPRRRDATLSCATETRDIPRPRLLFVGLDGNY